jgi:hypothetical protein
VATAQDIYNELAYYTLAHGDPAFIHQHVVDAFAVQEAYAATKPVAATKPIAIVFGLVGLYLHIEKGFTGRQVQIAHMRLAARRKQWPAVQLPEKRGEVTIADVLAASAGPERDAMIDRWCASVWDACKGCRPLIADLLQRELDINAAG